MFDWLMTPPSRRWRLVNKSGADQSAADWVAMNTAKVKANNPALFNLEIKFNFNDADSTT
jgi:hypothetical protein